MEPIAAKLNKYLLPLGSPDGRTRLYDTAVCHALARLRGSNKRILPARQL
jgi:hypothetical protein